MNNIKSVLIFTLIVISIVISSIALSSSKKIRWFNYNKVYDECQLKRDLEKDLEKVVSKRSSHLDSIRMEVSFLSNKVKSGKSSVDELTLFEDMKNRYLTLQNNYEQENIRLKEEYFIRIRKEIDENSKKYAAENQIDYLFSNVRDGSLIYAIGSEDVSNDVLDFINNAK